MKKLSILLLVALPLYVSAQDRNVFWAHGLNSNGDFWNVEYARAQREFKVRSSGFTYPTEQGVKAYANLLRTGSSPARGSRTIAIGHSMGGVAIRQADRDDPGLYGGMITFGSALDGARIANEVIARTPVDRFVNGSIENLRRGPIASVARSNWRKFIDAVNNTLKGDVKSELVRTLASGYLIDVTSNLTGDFNEAIRNSFAPDGPSVRDLAENSAYFNEIRAYSNSKPKIFAWGDENSPVHARMMVSSITFDNNFASLLITAYNQVAIAYRSSANGINTNGGVLCWSKCQEDRRRVKEAWIVGADYLERGWELSWNQLTGARFLETYTATERVYECDGENPLALEPDPNECDPGDDCGNCGWVDRRVTRTRWVNQPSDGLIKQSSQIGAISRWGGQAARLPEVNHMEMGVHPATNALLREAFLGTGSRYDKFFITPRR